VFGYVVVKLDYQYGWLNHKKVKIFEMLKVKILCIGKIKENYFIDALGEYAKRLIRYCDFCIDELAESKLKDETPTEIKKALVEEGKNILKRVEGKLVLLDRVGKMVDSFDVANILKEASSTTGKVTFVIGSSHGVSQEVKDKADLTISFGKITFPHQLFRVVLAEQIYRGFCINAGSPYHK